MATVRQYLHQNPKARVLEYARQTLTIGAAETSSSFTVETSALFLLAVVEVANWTNSVTGTLAIVNGYSDTLFSKASISKGATTLVPPMVSTDLWLIPMCNTVTVSFTLSGVPGGSGGTVKITLYGI